MVYTIKKAKIGDKKIFTSIQIESWKEAFVSILDKIALEQCTQLDRVIKMYQDLLKQNNGQGYILKVDQEPHCIV